MRHHLSHILLFLLSACLTACAPQAAEIFAGVEPEAPEWTIDDMFAMAGVPDMMYFDREAGQFVLLYQSAQNIENVPNLTGYSFSKAGDRGVRAAPQRALPCAPVLSTIRVCAQPDGHLESCKKLPAVTAGPDENEMPRS